MNKLQQLQEETGKEFDKLLDGMKPKVSNFGILEDESIKNELQSIFDSWWKNADYFYRVPFKSFIKEREAKAYEAGITATEVSCKGCGHHDTLYKTFFNSPEWEAWEKEVAKRMHEQADIEATYEGVWDVDEARELGCMSEGHFKDFIKFIRNKYEKEKSYIQVNHKRLE